MGIHIEVTAGTFASAQGPSTQRPPVDWSERDRKINDLLTSEERSALAAEGFLNPNRISGTWLIQRVVLEGLTVQRVRVGQDGIRTESITFSIGDDARHTRSAHSQLGSSPIEEIDVAALKVPENVWEILKTVLVRAWAQGLGNSPRQSV